MSVRILKGDCREVLRSLDADSVQTCITSPPYWGLRDYGIQPSVWGGDPDCDHEWGEHIAVNATNHTTKARWNHTRNGRDELQPIEKRVSWLRTEVKQGQFCQRCGAWAGAFGLEPTVQLYIDHAVEVFQEVWRVLKPDGTLWLNLGDSYTRPSDALLKPKDLVGMPWRVAFALQADRWYLRSEIIWAKPNAMPESVRDRPTKSHEQVFLLSKNERYFYDCDAVREPDQGADNNHRNVLTGQPSLEPSGGLKSAHAGLRTVAGRNGCGRNLRSVWMIATQPYTGAHFATFPTELASRCILAGCPLGGMVLDPFLGAGTTALVADRLGRECIGIELNSEYAGMAIRRVESDAGLFADVKHG